MNSVDNQRFRPSPREIGAIVLIVLATIFVFENTDETDIRFIIPEVTTPLWVALLSALVAGFIAGWLVGRRDR